MRLHLRPRKSGVPGSRLGIPVAPRLLRLRNLDHPRGWPEAVEAGAVGAVEDVIDCEHSGYIGALRLEREETERCPAELAYANRIAGTQPQGVDAAERGRRAGEGR